jgi:hypothetical protein
MVWGWFVFWVLSNTFVPNISNISSISISNRVCNDLGTAIGKVYTVFSVGSITITVLVGSKVSTRVIISNGITVLINSWYIIGRFVIWGWFMVCWSWVNYWFVHNWGMIWGWSVYYWGNIWSGLVCRSWVVYWGWFWVIDRGCVIRSWVIRS